MVLLTINVKTSAGVHQCKLEKANEGLLHDMLDIRRGNRPPDSGDASEGYHLSPGELSKTFEGVIYTALDNDVTRSMEITIELGKPYSEMLDMVKEQCGLDPGEYIRKCFQRVVDHGIDGDWNKPIAIAS